jgi:hypothetical protein
MASNLTTLPIEIRDPPNLITLPVEIRNIIWEYSMIETIDVCGSGTTVKHVKNPRIRLMLVCKTMYDEIRSLEPTYTLNLCSGLESTLLSARVGCPAMIDCGGPRNG